MFDQISPVVLVLIAVAVVALIVWLVLRSRRSVSAEPDAQRSHVADPEAAAAGTSPSQARRMAADTPETAEEANEVYGESDSEPRHSHDEDLDEKSGDPTLDTPATVEEPHLREDEIQGSDVDEEPAVTEEAAVDEAGPQTDTAAAPEPEEEDFAGEERVDVDAPVDAEGGGEVDPDDAREPTSSQPDAALSDAVGSEETEDTHPRYDYAQDKESETGVPIASAGNQRDAAEASEAARQRGYGDQIGSPPEEEAGSSADDYEVPRDEQGRRLDPYGNPVEE